MAVVSTSIAAASGVTNPNSVSAQFTGRRACFKHDNNSFPCTTQSLFQNVDSHIRLSSSRRGSKGVVCMGASGKNGTKESITELVSDLNNAFLEPHVDVVVSPSFVYIDQVRTSLPNWIEVSAQNCWTGKGGAFTGEIRQEGCICPRPRSRSDSLHWRIARRKRSWKNL